MKVEEFDRIASPSEFARSKYFYALIGGYAVTDERFFFERAYYPAYEILIITAGIGAYRHGQEWTGLVSGDCLLHDMRYPHAYKADPEHPFEMKYLVFDGDLLDKLWADFFSSPYVLFHPSALEGVSQVVDAILAAMPADGDPDGNERHISALIYQLLLDCLHHADRGAKSYGPVKPDAMIAAGKYLSEHFLTIENMEAAAKEVNLSYFHFSRQFKRYYGCTPKEYVSLKRIHHAKRLLLLTNKSITEIAGLSGFNNYNSFLHSFQQIERCSPKDYQKNWKMF